ncbi:MAG: hypothetical protein ACI4TE_06685 [Alphaproteobacteria bacterium]
MKKIHRLLICCILSAVFATPASAQMFYNAGTGFDSTGSSSYGGNSLRPAAEENNGSQEEAPYEKIVAKEIRERIRADAAYIVGEPEEALCYGIARKSPKKRSATIDGYAHTGNCGSLNETGMTEVQSKLFNAASYDMNVTKIASCVTTPRLALRFRKGFDFVDVILSGGNCPAVSFLYGGDTKEFSAKPIKDWLDTFIDAVSKDLEPVNPDEIEKAAAGMFKKRDPAQETAAEPEKPAAPKMWGRRVIRPEESETPPASDPSVPPPPR